MKEDKTDVRRNRVQNHNPATFDIHDRVNYAALSSKLIISKEKRMIHMDLELDDSICTVMDYFEINYVDYQGGKNEYNLYEQRIILAEV